MQWSTRYEDPSRERLVMQDEQLASIHTLVKATLSQCGFSSIIIRTCICNFKPELGNVEYEWRVYHSGGKVYPVIVVKSGNHVHLKLEVEAEFRHSIVIDRLAGQLVDVLKSN